VAIQKSGGTQNPTYPPPSIGRGTTLATDTGVQFRPLLAVALGVLASFCTSRASAAVIYTYDFPNNPGSGLAADQTNPQPSGATFSDFTRTTVTPGNSANVFSSVNWTVGGALDPAAYEGFSITAAAGYHLNLTSFNFDLSISAPGPTSMEAALFLNGSTTAYATFDLAPGSLTTYTFNFTALTDADNVTSATFKLYGWNAASSSGKVVLDNVITNGTISNAPEVDTEFAWLFPIALIISAYARRGLIRRAKL